MKNPAEQFPLQEPHPKQDQAKQEKGTDINTKDKKHEDSNEQFKGESPNVEIYVTDHNLRYPDAVSVEDEYELYKEMKDHGISSIRFDWDWKDVAPQPGVTDKNFLDRYIGAIKAMEEAGLEPPTLVLSNPPEWAAKLYRNDKEKFFKAYEEYVRSVGETLGQANVKIKAAQIFNEINHSLLSKYVDIKDIPKITGIVRNELSRTQPDLKISTSLIVSNVNDRIAKTVGLPKVSDFIARYKLMLKENFDRVSVDFYPGFWHNPLKGKKAFKQLNPLKKVFEQLAALGMEYEVGETGFPTDILGSTERGQRYFYDSFFRAFRQLLIDLKSRNIALPKRIGLYETQDEENISFGGKTEKLLKMNAIKKLSRKLPNPEYHMGLKDKEGKPKSILQGSLHPKESKTDKEQEMSRLKRIINYINRPVKKN